jgi:agmatinase
MESTRNSARTAPASPRPDFDPGAAAGPDSGIFGLRSSPEQAAVHVLGVPFDATTSFRKGAAGGPLAILRASRQVDLFDLLTGKPYQAGIWMAPLDPAVTRWNDEATLAAGPVIAAGGAGDDPALLAAARRVDAIQHDLNRWVEERAQLALRDGKLLALVGGDHSVPFGSIQAHAERYPGLGLLHVDAHADLRAAYEGFTWSHASILRNVLERIGGVGPILQVGMRDLSEEEHELMRADGRLSALLDHEWADARHRSHDLRSVVRRALEPLPAQVYVTFDVDGLDPALCPHTGTPVPGGLTWNEAMLWLEELVLSGRTIVGLDLNEVAPEPGRESGAGWDENVGARLLYRLIGFALRSRG